VAKEQDMRAPLAVLAAVATASAVVVAASAEGAAAVVSVPTPSLTPLPTVSVPVPQPTVTAPALPSTSVPVPSASVPGTGGGNDGGSGGGGTGGTTTAPGPAGTGGAATTGSGKPATTKRERKAQDATPMLAGTPQARDLLDDESSPALRAASRDFLAADNGIAEIARQKRIMAQLRQAAAEQGAVYKALDLDVLTARTASETLHQRYDSVRGQLVADARSAYVTGRPTTDDSAVTGMAAAVERLSAGSTRADMRVGDLTVRREAVRADVVAIVARYAEAQRTLEDANRRLAELASQRSDALQAVRAAGPGDRALHQQRLAESGELGAQIRAASARLERSGSTVDGTGDMARPAVGQVTSPFGMRFHPILRYTKLHTGTDFAGGGGAVRAADDGRVIMTAVSGAYGNLTVVDHGVVDGERVTTAYAHQARVLVAEGDVVRKGETIGVIGSTGYSTGPHLHFEVREDGAVVDPGRYL
jgi:murein DD-endopeptidase MepM/ murein hydrolase activator NlpD